MHGQVSLLCNSRGSDTAKESSHVPEGTNSGR